MYNAFNPYESFRQYGYQPVQLVKVNGMDGAKAYQMPPNSSVALFHESEDLMYVKTTGGAGFPTVRVFRFEPYDEPTIEPVKYVTMDEFERFKEELYAKQSLQQQQ